MKANVKSSIVYTPQADLNNGQRCTLDVVECKSVNEPDVDALRILLHQRLLMTCYNVKVLLRIKQHYSGFNVTSPR